MSFSAADLESILKQQQMQFELLLKNLNVSTKPTVNSVQAVPKFDQYVKSKEKWDQYVERLEQHFILHKVDDDEVKRACLLASVGPDVYQLIKNLFVGEKVTEKSFAEICNCLQLHYQEEVNKYAARYYFNERGLKNDQTYADWVAELRGLAGDCDFICKNPACKGSYAEQMIIDVIIRRTPHPEIRRQCLQDPKLTLDSLVQKAQSYLQTCKTVEVVQGNNSLNNSNYQSSSEVACEINSEYKDSSEIAYKMSPQYKTVVRKQNVRNHNNWQATKQHQKYRGCPGCFVYHEKVDCPAKNQICRKCNGKNHFASVCQSKPKTKTNCVIDDSNFVSDNEVNHVSSVEHVNTVERKKNQIFIPLVVNGRHVNFQWDTGATCSMVGLEGYEAIGSPPTFPTTCSLRTYSGQKLSVKGKCFVEVKAAGQSAQKLPILILNQRKCANLLGLPWADAIGLTDFGLSALNVTGTVISQMDANVETTLSALQVSDDTKMQKLQIIQQKHPTVFQSGLGHCVKTKAHVQLKPDATPVFCKARPIPFAQKQALREELQRLEDQGVLEKTAYSEWAVPIVLVSKPNGKVRICGDFVEVNRRSHTKQYPIPHIDDLCAKMNGGKFFTTLDLSDAYLQVELDDSSKEICVINTPYGMYKYNRMPFGISSAPAVFQQVMDQMTSALPGVAAFLDDIIIMGRNEEEHWLNVEKVIAALSSFGFRIRPEKCSWAQTSCEYLGFEFSSQGRRPSSAAINAIQALPRPKSNDEAKAFLGKVGYYSVFIPQMSSKAAPLNALLQKNASFEWTEAEENSFQMLKQDIVNALSLTHYDPSKQLVLATDASPYGTGAVLSQIEDGVEKPIAFASKTLTTTQKRYSQLDREGLGVIFGISKFHKFLYGRKFILQLDNKPLSAIFSLERKIPTMAAERLTRWALKLRAYDFVVRFRPTAQHSNADCLSRLPVGPDEEFDKLENEEEQETVHLIEATLFESPVNFSDVVRKLGEDNTLSKVQKHIFNGDWPLSKPQDRSLLQYWHLKDRLFVHQNAVMLHTEAGIRVVIPKPLREEILKTLHIAHFGIARMKQTMRQYVWWPGANADVERFCKECRVCRENAVNPPQKYQSWPEPEEAWSRIHLDFAGPFLGKMWLVAIDAKTRFPYLAMMNVGQTTAKHTISALKHIFAIEGLCDTIVSDNGSQFVAEEFGKFCHSHGILHITSPVAHPSSNGIAERFVATFKQHMKKCIGNRSEFTTAELWQAARQILFTYRCMPHSELEGRCPAQMLHGRRPKNLMSLIVSDSKREEEDNNFKSVETYSFPAGTKVYFRNFGRGPRWLPGEVVQTRGRVIRIIASENGRVKRHTNQLQMRLETSGGANETERSSIEYHPEQQGSSQDTEGIDSDSIHLNPARDPAPQRDPTRNHDPSPHQHHARNRDPSPRRNPARNRDPPNRYGFSD